MGSNAVNWIPKSPPFDIHDPKDQKLYISYLVDRVSPNGLRALDWIKGKTLANPEFDHFVVELAVEIAKREKTQYAIPSNLTELNILNHLSNSERLPIRQSILQLIK